jgi:flagellar biosynthetic protein FlhB
MADERDDFERSEEPTPKRKEEARKQGQIARARSLIPSAALLGAVLVLPVVGPRFMETIHRLFHGFFSLAGEPRELSPEELLALAFESTLITLPMLGLLFGAVVVAGVSGGLAQSRFLWSTELLQPKFSRLNPLSGLRRLVSLESFAEVGKSLLEILCLGALGFFFLRADLPALVSLPSFDLTDVLLFSSQEGFWLLKAGVGVMIVLSFFDYLFQSWRLQVQLRMSRQEVKEETREQEGDPHIKGRLRAIRQKMARQRMMAEVPQADVVITNPTHLAIAIRYRSEEMSAPQVVAKGAGYVAQRIREIARSHSVPIMENKPLAQLLYRQVDIGQAIPESLYRAVAEVLAYVFRLRRERGMGARGQRLGA